MSVSHRYRNFGKKAEQATKTFDEANESLEEQKLQSFESGYQAGWDDALKAQEEDSSKISAEFAQNLQDISFTYHEAMNKLSASFEPVLKEIVQKILPEVSRQTLGMHVFEQVNKLLKNSLVRPIEIVVSPDNEEEVKTMAEDALKESFVICSDPTLKNEQVFVRVGTEEKQIDLSGIIENVAKATEAFFHELKGKDKNG